MKFTPIALSIAVAYGQQINRVESAAWLWFDWTRDRDGRLVYRWRL